MFSNVLDFDYHIDDFIEDYIHDVDNDNNDINNVINDEIILYDTNNIQRLTDLEVQDFLNNQTELLLDILFMGKLEVDGIEFSIGSHELMVLYKSLYINILKNDMQSNHKNIVNLILEELILSNEKLILDSNINNKYLAYTFLDLHKNIILCMLSISFSQYIQVIVKSMQHIQVESIEQIHSIIHNYVHSIHGIMIYKLWEVISHFENNHYNQNVKLYESLCQTLDDMYNHNTMIFKFSSFINKATMTTGAIVVNPFLGMIEKIMYFCVQSPMHGCFMLLLIIYCCILVYIFAKALGMYIHSVIHVFSNILNESHISLYILSHNQMFSRKFIDYKNESCKTRQIIEDENTGRIEG